MGTWSLSSVIFSTGEPDTTRAYDQVIVWAWGQARFTAEAKEEFAQADNADAWLVAYSIVEGCVVVTHEQLDPNVKRRIPMPNACQAFGVRCVDTFRMLRELRVRL